MRRIVGKRPRQRYAAHVQRFQQVFQVEKERVVSDLQPRLDGGVQRRKHRLFRVGYAPFLRQRGDPGTPEACASAARVAFSSRRY